MQFGLSGFLWVGFFEMKDLHLVDRTAALGFDIFEVPVADPADLGRRSLGQSLSTDRVDREHLHGVCAGSLVHQRRSGCQTARPRPHASDY